MVNCLTIYREVGKAAVVEFRRKKKWVRFN